MFLIKKINYLFSISIISFLFIPNLNADDIEKGKSTPSVNLKDLMGKTINSSDFDNDSKPIIISFWATWCKPCLEELNTISDLYDEWVEETGVKLIAISIDDSRSSKRVAPFTKSKKWKFEIYLDENGDFKRAMGVSNPPHTFLLDANKNIVFEHNGYASGDELHLYEKIKNITKK
ncbi:MAG: TlpA family protein disulfide reductase [Bacteroidetes bacterium]|nr:TlpA family protein disulfide reductase [Bacteroidota bacterium]